MRWLRDAWLWLRGVPQCTACGLCCAPSAWCSSEEHYWGFINLKDGDRERLKRPEQKHVQRHPDRPGDQSMRLRILDNQWACGALTGTLGKSVSCSVYNRRPQSCRDWPRGGARCRFVLKRASITKPKDRVQAGRYPHGDPWWMFSFPPWWRIQRRWRFWKRERNAKTTQNAKPIDARA